MVGLVAAFVVAGAIALLVDEGEGTGDGASTASGTRGSGHDAAPDLEPAVAAYMSALATRDAGAMDEMRSVSAPGSAADLYASYQIERERSLSEDPEVIEVSPDGTVEACAALADGTETCAVFSDFELDERGRLDSFSVDGLTIDGRVVGPGAFGTSGGVLAQLVAAYETGEDSVFVIVDVTNGLNAEVTVAGENSPYVSPDGRETMSAEGTVRGPTIRPHETGRVVLVFKDSEVGGSLDLEVVVNGSTTPEAPVSVAIG